MDFGTVMAYLGGQFVGSLIGAFLCWVAYKQHFDEEPDQGTKLSLALLVPHTWQFRLCREQSSQTRTHQQDRSKEWSS